MEIKLYRSFYAIEVNVAVFFFQHFEYINWGSYLTFLSLCFSYLKSE